LGRRWKNNGDWEIQGELIPSLVCPADAVAEILKAFSDKQKSFAYDRESLSNFRDYEFIKYRGTARWWQQIQRNKLQIVYSMLKDSKIRDLMLDLFVSAQKLVQTPDKKIPKKDIDNAIRFFNALQGSKKRRTQIEATRALDFIQQCRGKTVREVLELMDALPPSRYH